MTAVHRSKKANDFRVPETSVEIERKFVVAKLPEGIDQFSSKEILQGYLAVTRERTEVRIRRRGNKCSLTVKHGVGKTRTEEEIRISKRQFVSLWELTGRKRLKKLRYCIPYEGLNIEVDVYQERLKGLVTAEVEFPSEEASNDFQPPGWLGLEVTDDDRYKNRNLALRGFPAQSQEAIGDRSSN
jgi:adenylate cyclase